MQRTEVRAAGEAAAEAFGGTVDHVQRTHRAIAGRVFGAVGAATRASHPSRATTGRRADVAGAVGTSAWIHDRIADGVYGLVREIGVRSARTAARTGALIGPRDAGSIAEHPTGAAVLGALNGAFGERFAAPGGPLGLEMTVRHGGRDLPLTPAAPW